MLLAGSVGTRLCWASPNMYPLLQREATFAGRAAAMEQSCLRDKLGGQLQDV